MNRLKKIKNIFSITHLVDKFIKSEEATELCDSKKVMQNIISGLKSGRAVVLVDDKEDPTAFIWAEIIKTPALYTEIKEMIVMASWAEDQDTMLALRQKSEKVARKEGCQFHFICQSSMGGDSQLDKLDAKKLGYKKWVTSFGKEL